MLKHTEEIWRFDKIIPMRWDMLRDERFIVEQRQNESTGRRSSGWQKKPV